LDSTIAVLTPDEKKIKPTGSPIIKRLKMAIKPIMVKVGTQTNPPLSFDLGKKRLIEEFYN
jgi:hypothetical protein